MIRTLFGFETQLKSRDLNLISAMVNGIGVINGFNNATIEGNRLVLNSDRSIEIIQPSLDNVEDDIYRVCHSCIARDGSMYLNTDHKLVVPQIIGYRSKLNEVLLFAVHQSTSDPVDNPVVLVAYWNPFNDISLYDLLYKPYIENPDIQSLYQFSEDTLNQYLKGLDFYNESNMLLLGVYGTYVNLKTRNQEYFSLPFRGSKRFPTSLPEEDGLVSIIKTLVNHQSKYETIVTEMASKVNNLQLTADNLNRRVDELTRRLGLVESK